MCEKKVDVFRLTAAYCIYNKIAIFEQKGCEIVFIMQDLSNEFLQKRIEKAFIQLAVKIQLLKGDINKKANNMDNFLNALADDLNVSNALTELFNVMKLANQELRKNPIDLSKLEDIFANYRDMLNILGLKIDYPLLTEEDEQIYNEYIEYKKEKNFAKSDELRNILIARRII